MTSDDVDIVILGAGAAGLATALEATRRGASVRVLETWSAPRHTPNVRMSGGWVMTVDDPRPGADYLAACADGLVDRARTDDWARRAQGLETWLGGLGVELGDDGLHRAPEHPHLPGSSSIRIRRARTDLPSPFREHRGAWPAEGPAVGGEALYRGLMHAVLGSDARISFDSRASSLVVDGGRVAGVRVDGTDEVIRASAGVVVATGGYGGSPELVRNHLSVPDTRFYGNPRNDGSGLRLAVSVGAEIARMNRFAGRGIASFPTPAGLQLGFMIDMAGGGYVICDQGGRRYTDEFPQAALFHDFYYAMQAYDAAHGGFTRSPSYYVFDQRRMDAGPLTFVERGVCGVGLYDWSADNTRELANGWIGRGATPSEAAEAVGAVASAHFDEAVADFNRGCAVGVDTWGRPVDSLVPLDAPPYYCLALHVGGPHTSGGVERDARGQVLAALGGLPVPGLYGAGELGQAVGVVYPAAVASLSDALCSGLAVADSALEDR